MVKGLLGFTSIESYIDLQKLLFLGALCRLKPLDVAYKLLILRAYQFMNKLTVNNTGFVKDIVRILEKYSLYSHLTEFLHSGSFPAKALWKRVCEKAVFNHEQRKWSERIRSDNEFELFKTIHFHLTPAACWRVAQKNPRSLNQMRRVAKVTCLTRNHLKCPNCDLNTHDIISHLLFECTNQAVVEAKNDYISYIKNYISMDLHYYMMHINRLLLMKYLLCFMDDNIKSFLSADLYAKFMCANACLLYKLHIVRNP